MARLSFVGQVVLDQSFEVEAFSATGGKHAASGFRSEAGGLATNAARAALRLRQSNGPGIALHAAVGDDAAGRWLVEQLCAEGVARSALQCVAGAKTGVSAVLIDAGGERQIHNYRGTASSAARVPGPDDLQGSCGVLADPRWPAAASAALHWAGAQRVVSVLDAEIAPMEVLRALSPLAGWVVFSSAGLAAWAGTGGGAGPDSLLQDAAAHCAGRELIVTQGAQGLIWRRPDGRVQVLPAFAVPVVNSNGAGDVFHGALLVALAEARAPEASVRWAMAAAALACSGAGGAATAPGRAEVDRFLAQRS